MCIQQEGVPPEGVRYSFLFSLLGRKATSQQQRTRRVAGKLLELHRLLMLIAVAFTGIPDTQAYMLVAACYGAAWFPLYEYRSHTTISGSHNH